VPTAFLFDRPGGDLARLRRLGPPMANVILARQCIGAQLEFHALDLSVPLPPSMSWDDIWGDIMGRYLGARRRIVARRRYL